MVRFIPQLSLICILPALIASVDVSATSIESAETSAHLSVLNYIYKAHSQGISYPSFTLSISNLQLDAIQPQNAILPSAQYSIHDRPSRMVGHLGYYHLVSKKEDTFVLLTVNRDDGDVNGVVKQFDGHWTVIDDGLKTEERDLRAPTISYASYQPERELQAFHSDYLYQIDLHLDIDYEFVNNNGGALCNTFNYINTLVTAANVVLEREIMTHMNVKYIRQTDFYDDISSTTEALARMKNENGVQWHKEGIDLHYALLGKELNGGLGERSGIAFIEDSLCDSSKGFGVVSGLKGGFERLDERLGYDLKRFMYAIG